MSVDQNFPVMTEEGAAEFLQIPLYTLERLRKKGKGPPHIKLTGKVRYLRSSIEEWIKTNESVDFEDLEEPA